MSFCSQICTTVRNRQMTNNSPDPNRVGQMNFCKRNNIYKNILLFTHGLPCWLLLLKN